jgi:hypothetical protein
MGMILTVKWVELVDSRTMEKATSVLHVQNDLVKAVGGHTRTKKIDNVGKEVVLAGPYLRMVAKGPVLKVYPVTIALLESGNCVTG